ncbi:MAG: hypothetical protein AMXMBFR36_29160 [Acidobacteriota bacterium]
MKVRKTRSCRLLAAGWLLASGCGSTRTAPLPEISPEQFTLILEADTEALGRGEPTEVVHRLSNQSDVAVCLNASRELRTAGEAFEVRVTMDAFCSVPLTVVEPGGQAEWRSIVELGRCLEEADLGFRPPLRMRCGAEVPFDIVISVFRWTGKAPEWGMTKIPSRPLHLTRASDRQSGAATGQ